MFVLYYVFLFIVCCIALYFAGNWVVSGMTRIAKFFGWKEFAVAFFVMAMAGSLPNLILGLISIANGVPELSLGDVVGGNVVDMTFTVALAVLLSRNGISSKSRTVQTSLIFTFIAAVLPLILFAKGELSRVDGIILIGFFFAYVYWLLSKKERFKKVYNNYTVPVGKQFAVFIKDLVKVGAGILILAGVAQVVVFSAQTFAAEFNIPLTLVGILVVGLGNCFPEIYFSALAAKSRETHMILGDIMGSIIIPATLVLGIICVITPIKIQNVAMFETARYSLLVASLLFFAFVRSGQKITKKEGVILLFVYIGFLLIEVFVK